MTRYSKCEVWNLSAFAALAVLLTAGCAAHRPSPLGPGVEIRGKRLTEVVVGEDHAVVFWEFAPGVVGINETARISRDGEGFEPAFVPHPRIFTLVDAYRSLQRDKNASVPNALVEADRRVAARRSREATYPPLPSSPEASDDDSPASSADGEANSTCQSISGACPGGCSSDAYNDQWGKKWFLNRYCFSNFPYTDCVTNYKKRWAKWYTFLYTGAMAADFDVGARFAGGHYEYVSGPLFGLLPGFWNQSQDWNQFVKPRHVSFWIVPGYGHSTAKGLNPCKRIHFSAMGY